MVMTHRAQEEQMQQFGQVSELKPDELFQKFIREYLCWFDQDLGHDYKLVSVTNGVFQTAQVSAQDKIRTPSSNQNNGDILHPVIDLLRK